MAVLLNPKSSKTRPIYFDLILVVCPMPYGILRLGQSSFFFFCPNQFSGEALSAQIEGP